jgi:hypothetical protein
VTRAVARGATIRDSATVLIMVDRRGATLVRERDKPFMAATVQAWPAAIRNSGPSGPLTEGSTARRGRG